MMAAASGRSSQQSVFIDVVIAVRPLFMISPAQPSKIPTHLHSVRPRARRAKRCLPYPESSTRPGRSNPEALFSLFPQVDPSNSLILHRHHFRIPREDIDSLKTPPTLARESPLSVTASSNTSWDRFGRQLTSFSNEFPSTLPSPLFSLPSE